MCCIFYDTTELTARNLTDDVDHLVLGDISSVAVPEILQQAAVLHELSDNVDGLHKSADGVEL